MAVPRVPSRLGRTRRLEQIDGLGDLAPVGKAAGKDDPSLGENIGIG